jgi:hypothetical protein
MLITFKGTRINAIQPAAVVVFTISVDAFSYNFFLIRGNGLSCVVFVWVWNLVYQITVVIQTVDGDRGGTMVKVLCYKSEGCGFDSRWCYWNFSLT